MHWLKIDVTTTEGIIPIFADSAHRRARCRLSLASAVMYRVYSIRRVYRAIMDIGGRLIRIAM